MRLPWSYGSELSVTLRPYSLYKRRCYWRHDRLVSAHVVAWQIGRLRFVRVRPTAWQAKRLGLPIVCP